MARSELVGDELLPRARFCSRLNIKAWHFALADERLVQRGDIEATGERRRDAPGEDLTRGPVHHGDQEHEAVRHSDAGYIGGPDLIRPIDRERPQKIREDGVRGVADSSAAGDTSPRSPCNA